MEKVPQGMINELESVDCLNQIIDGVYQEWNIFPCLEEYLEEENYSDRAYLKLIRHINGTPRFQAEDEG